MADFALLFLLAVIVALLAIIVNQHRPQATLPLIAASAPQVNPQCAIPTLDYSKKPLRLDSKAIA
jgi:hypothetical protein